MVFKKFKIWSNQLLYNPECLENLDKVWESYLVVYVCIFEGLLMGSFVDYRSEK